MKELTIEQKAKRYDEVIDKVAHFIKKHIGFGCIIHPNSSEAKELFNIFPELKVSEDGKIKQEIIDYLSTVDDKELIPYEYWIAWLEKQNSNVANKEYWRGYREGKQEILDKYVELEKQSGQKPIDKVEPKFHEGDWVVYNNDICQIVKREEGCNKLVTVFGIEKELVNERNLSTARLWSITDAKDGDVLSDGTTIFIFKDLLSDSSVMSYCDYDTNSGESDAFCPLSMNLVCSKITPAAKEQRDTLLKAMADAGYTFDFEKKKLKKIEQNPSWNEEDDNRISEIIEYLDELYNKYRFDLDELNDKVNWLKSLKERMKGE